MAALTGRLRGSKITYWKLEKTMLVFSNRHGRAEIPACLSAVSEQSSFTAESQEKEKWKWSGLLLFIPGVATFGLGTWQLFRRLKKMELIEHRQKRLEQDPVLVTSVLPEASDSQSKEKISSLEFRKVVCEGVYDESKSIYIGPRSRSVSGVTENGYYVVTPLMPVQQNERYLYWLIEDGFHAVGEINLLKTHLMPRHMRIGSHQRRINLKEALGGNFG